MSLFQWERITGNLCFVSTRFSPMCPFFLIILILSFHVILSKTAFICSLTPSGGSLNPGATQDPR